MSGRYLDRVERAARKKLPKEIHHYIAQGARDGVTTAEAESAWDRLRLWPRVLMDVTEVDPATSLLGTAVRSPVAIAPSTLQRAAHPEGEVAMARAAAGQGTLLVVSSNAGSRFADIGATGVDWWLQMYVTADRTATVPVVERAVEAGAKAIVLTADTPVVGVKYHRRRPVWDVVDPAWLRVNFDDHHDDDHGSASGPGVGPSPGPGADPGGPGLEKATDLGPQDVAWLGQRFGLPVVVKGVLHPADARRCVDAGAGAVWVSNHGGRQLDGAVPTAEALPRVAEAVAGDAEVYVDGGVRRATHVLAAAALGARAVFLGRPPVWALADAGEEGVSRLLSELREEVVEALRLSGSSSLSAVTPDLLAGGRFDSGPAAP
jgi:4-hydroxymandelate oxidase